MTFRINIINVFIYPYKTLQLTIRGSGKLKQTLTKLLALPGGIKTYTSRNSGDDTVQTKLSRRSPQNWTLFWNTFKIQTNNAPHFHLIESGVGYRWAMVRIPLLKPKRVHKTGCAVSAIYALCAGTAAHNRK